MLHLRPFNVSLIQSAILSFYTLCDPVFRSLHYGGTGYAVTRKTSLEVGRLSPEGRASREKRKEKVKKEKKKRKKRKKFIKKNDLIGFIKKERVFC